MSNLVAETSSGSIVMWSITLIGLLIGGLVAALRVKKWMNEEEDSSGGGFTLSDLRQMHKAGRMTDEEFEKAKLMIVGTTKAAKPKNPARDLRDSDQRPRP